MADSKHNLCWGRYDHKIDEKGRLLLPYDFRDVLGDRLVLVAGPNKEIRVYSDAAFALFEKELAGQCLLDEYDEDFLYLQRIFGNCERLSHDTSYRISLPDRLRNHAGLMTDLSAVMIGCGNRVEIWSSPLLSLQDSHLDLERIKNVAKSRRGLLGGLSANAAASISSDAIVA